MKFFVFSFFLYYSFSVFGGIEESSISKQIEKKSENYLKEDQKKRKLQSLIFKISKELEKLEDERRDIEEKIYLTKKNANRGITDLKIREEMIKKERKKIHKQLRMLASWYKLGIGDVLFSSTSIKELDKRVFYVKRLLSTQGSRLNQFIDDKNDYQVKKLSLREQLKQLAILRKDLGKKERKTKKLKNYHTTLYKKADKRQKDLFASIRSLKSHLSSENEVDADYFFTKKGKLDLPIEIKHWEAFGIYPTKHRRIHLTRSGIELFSFSLQKVRLVASGKVVFQGNLEAYGKTLIVDHGNRYYTVYAGLNHFEVNFGDELIEGAELGRIDEGKRMFFEIRKFSEAMDPRQWLKNEKLLMAKDKNNRSGIQL
ncbi:MAG: peptidoglycan DD-metalloendopeptidase family protein [Bdellovibrionota bacterium]|nr:peptidoglycan DD-metalloendopeptidase family protein [Bdellovibrionota bacterium]